MKHLLHLGADVDHYDDVGFGALHHAVLSGFEDVVRVLLEAGADINARNLHFGTPLCLASLKGRENVMNLLLEYRANIHLSGGECGTPLHCAVYANKMPSIAQILIDHGAKIEDTRNINRGFIAEFMGATASTDDPNIDTEHYPTVRCRPLALAALESREDLVQLFLTANAMVNDRGDEGSTALEFATDTGDLNCVRRLTDAGGSLPSGEQVADDPMGSATNAALQSDNVGLLANQGSRLDHTDTQDPKAETAGHSRLISALAGRDASKLLHNGSPEVQSLVPGQSSSKGLDSSDTRERAIINILAGSLPVSFSDKVRSLSGSTHRTCLVRGHASGMVGIYPFQISALEGRTVLHSCRSGSVKLRRGDIFPGYLNSYEIRQLVAILRSEIGSGEAIVQCCEIMAARDVVWARTDETTVKRIVRFWLKVLNKYDYARVKRNQKWVDIWLARLAENRLPTVEDAEERLKIWAKVFKLSLEDMEGSGWIFRMT